VLVCEWSCDGRAEVPKLGGTVTRVATHKLGKRHGELNERVQGQTTSWASCAATVRACRQADQIVLGECKI